MRFDVFIDAVSSTVGILLEGGDMQWPLPCEVVLLWHVEYETQSGGLE